MADYTDFDFDETQRAAWGEFSDRLDEVLSVMDATADLTISVTSVSTGPRPGIRFTVREPGVVTALVSGSANGAPTAVESVELIRLGWFPPSEREPGFHAEADQADSARLAALASDTLNAVFSVPHPIFLEPDQLAEILQGQAEWTPLEPRKLKREEQAVKAGGQAELDGLVDAELRRLFGHPPLRNEQGDVAIRVGSAVVFLRSTADCRELVLFSPLVHDVANRSRACEVLNDLNVESRYGRFALHRDRVFAQISVPAKPFVPAHLRQALRALSQIADGIDEELATKLGGRTTFSTP
ncbi:MAG: hypothetical protein IPJ61_09930 [Tessaracoccus sp.]|uniref:T3SS (YopN, CesT) and YbjN peptide-binding chaperone 1 n=1 Tax=Tessaracoccus sp. TaxID=1971211 RepID=UPI001EB1B151|nr:hypothetical protein [Tessaracoccus sp.]MBK7821374.1 hypothetical protein [Tessaracoccus sp.]